MKQFTALALVFVLLLGLCACGGSDDAQTVLGTYKLYAMDYDEKNVVFTDELFEGENYITLKKGGSAELCLEGDKADVKWKADGKSLTVTADDGDMQGTVSDGILTLLIDDSNLYFVGEGANKASIKAVTLDELLNGLVGDPSVDTPNTPATEPAPQGPTEVQQMWNGWWYGCIDMDGCTENWEFLNGATYDATLYIELDADGCGKLAIYDPAGNLISNEHSNVYVQADCHADTQYLYADSGTAFNSEINPSDWMFVHNRDIPEKIHVGSESVEASGAVIGYDFQFKPWGDLWEGDPYTQFIPFFDSYLDAVGTGLTGPFGDTFPGFGIAESPAGGGNTEVDPGGNAGPEPGSNGGNSALLGSDPAKLDVNDRGVMNVYYPADRFTYDDWYGKLKNETTGVGILLDPMLGSGNFEELKASYEQNNSDEENYSLVETTVNGYKAQIMKYSDWLGATRSRTATPSSSGRSSTPWKS